MNQVRIHTEWNTSQLVAHGVSLARLCDGELNYLWSRQPHRYQRFDKALQARLKEVLHADEPGLLIGVPRVIGPHAQNFGTDREISINLEKFWSQWRGKLTRHLPPRTYGSGFISYPDRHMPPHRWPYYRLMWGGIVKGRDVVLVGNEREAAAVQESPGILGGCNLRYVYTPERDAYAALDQTLAECRDYPVDALMLVSVGLTGTVLAHDLHRDGYHAVDIGRLLKRFRRIDDGTAQ